jgi:SAM-dependent methyltransferase
MQAALGLSQIGRLDQILDRKRSLDRRYREGLGSVAGISMQHHAEWARPVPWMIGIVLHDAVEFDAAEMAQRLAEHGVDTRPYFLGMHEQPVFLGRGLFAGERFPVAERLSRRGLYLPSSPNLSDESVERVCAAVQAALDGKPAEAVIDTRPRKDPGEAETSFGSDYAAAYDLLYESKDYPGEVDALESCFDRFSGSVNSVLDLGCGTGRHLELLLDRGYRSTGVDRAPGMLERAAKRLERFDDVELVESDIESLRLPGRKWDAVLMMFAVLSYHPDDDDLLDVLRAARTHTSPGGLLIGDFWYGPSVLAEPPGARTKTVGEGNEQWVRHVDSDHDPRRQIVTVRYRLEHIVDGKRRSESREQHLLRYLFPREVELLLDLAGFRLLHLGDWPAVDDPPGSSGYAAALVARAC